MTQEILRIPTAILVEIVLFLVGTVGARLLRAHGNLRARRAREVCVAELTAYDQVISVASHDVGVMLGLIDELSRERDTALRWLSEDFEKKAGN